MVVLVSVVAFSSSGEDVDGSSFLVGRVSGRKRAMSVMMMPP